MVEEGDGSHAIHVCAFDVDLCTVEAPVACSTRMIHSDEDIPRCDRAGSGSRNGNSNLEQIRIQNTDWRVVDPHTNLSKGPGRPHMGAQHKSYGLTRLHDSCHIQP